MSRSGWRCLWVLLVVASWSCSPTEEAPPFLVLAGPREVARIEVTDEMDEILWLLEAAPPRPLDAIWYGILPEGFRQIEPTDDRRPRPLVPGELVTTTTLTSLRRFTHTGVAKSTEAMEILNYSMELRAASD